MNSMLGTNLLNVIDCHSNILHTCLPMQSCAPPSRTSVVPWAVEGTTTVNGVGTESRSGAYLQEIAILIEHGTGGVSVLEQLNSVTGRKAADNYRLAPILRSFDAIEVSIRQLVKWCTVGHEVLGGHMQSNVAACENDRLWKKNLNSPGSGRRASWMQLPYWGCFRRNKMLMGFNCLRST